MSGIKEPSWAVEYLKERRRLYRNERRPTRRAIKNKIAALNKARDVFLAIQSNLPLRMDGRSEQTVEDLGLAIHALETLLTSGRTIDTVLDAAVNYLARLYRVHTGTPHYLKVGELVIKYFSDVLPSDIVKGTVNGNLGEWARKKATRYARHLEKLAGKGMSQETHDQIGKSILPRSL